MKTDPVNTVSKTRFLKKLKKIGDSSKTDDQKIEEILKIYEDSSENSKIQEILDNKSKSDGEKLQEILEIVNTSSKTAFLKKIAEILDSSKTDDQKIEEILKIYEDDYQIPIIYKDLTDTIGSKFFEQIASYFRNKLLDELISELNENVRNVGKFFKDTLFNVVLVSSTGYMIRLLKELSKQTEEVLEVTKEDFVTKKERITEIIAKYNQYQEAFKTANISVSTPEDKQAIVNANQKILETLIGSIQQLMRTIQKTIEKERINKIDYDTEITKLKQIREKREKIIEKKAAQIKIERERIKREEERPRKQQEKWDNEIKPLITELNAAISSLCSSLRPFIGVRYSTARAGGRAYVVDETSQETIFYDRIKGLRVSEAFSRQNPVRIIEKTIDFYYPDLENITKNDKTFKSCYETVKGLILSIDNQISALNRI